MNLRISLAWSHFCYNLLIKSSNLLCSDFNSCIERVPQMAPRKPFRTERVCDSPLVDVDREAGAEEDHADHLLSTIQHRSTDRIIARKGLLPGNPDRLITRNATVMSTVERLLLHYEPSSQRSECLRGDIIQPKCRQFRRQRTEEAEQIPINDTLANGRRKRIYFPAFGRLVGLMRARIQVQPSATLASTRTPSVPRFHGTTQVFKTQECKTQTCSSVQHSRM